jgi:hypothetical protein
MAIYKSYKRRRVFEGQSNYEIGKFYAEGQSFGQRYHKLLKEATTLAEAQEIENQILQKIFEKFGKSSLETWESILGGRADRRKRAAEKSLYVYIMESGGYYKIGHTSDIGKRIRDIAKTIIPFDTKVLLTVRHEKAKKIEREAHKQYKDKRIRGEWFSFTETELAEVKLFLTSQK